MKEYRTCSPEQTEALGETLAAGLQGGEVLACFGGMGMGKTAFARGLARGLGSDDAVSSPTFALVHEYRGKIPLYHFDMFRVSSWEDLYSTGFFDYLDTGAVLLIRHPVSPACGRELTAGVSGINTKTALRFGRLFLYERLYLNMSKGTTFHTVRRK